MHGQPYGLCHSSNLCAPAHESRESKWSSSVLSQDHWGLEMMSLFLPFDFSSQANYKTVPFARQTITASILLSYIPRLEAETSLHISVQEAPSGYTHQVFPMILSPYPSSWCSDAPPVWFPDPATDQASSQRWKWNAQLHVLEKTSSSYSHALTSKCHP